MKWRERVMRRGQPPEAAPYATTPNGAPYPLRSWPPDAAIDIQNLAEWTDRFSLPNVAARDAEIPTPYPGQMCYLQDTGTLQCHNGFVWVGDPAPLPLMTMLNGWGAGASTMQLHFDGMADVHLVDLSRGASTSLEICQLPANYTPKKGQLFNVGWVYIGGVGPKSSRFDISQAVTGKISVALEPDITLSGVLSAGALFNYPVDFKAVR